jgi:nitric oxide dioxygenase
MYIHDQEDLMLEAQKEIVKSTLPALRQHGETITTVFYQRMLEAHPELRAMFSAADQESGVQAKRLAGAILAYVGNIDRLDLLGPAVTNICQRHVNVNVQPEQYPIVGKHLLEAIQIVLGDAATPEVIDAWAAAYGDLAEIMIAREKTMYEEQQEENLATASA